MATDCIFRTAPGLINGTNARLLHGIITGRSRYGYLPRQHSQAIRAVYSKQRGESLRPHGKAEPCRSSIDELEITVSYWCGAISHTKELALTEIPFPRPGVAKSSYHFLRAFINASYLHHSLPRISTNPPSFSFPLLDQGIIDT